MGEDFKTGDIDFQFMPDREKLPVIGYMAYFKLKKVWLKKDFILPKSNAKLTVNNTLKTYNNPSGRWEILTLTYWLEKTD